MSPLTIAAIVPVFNRPKVVCDALRSIRGQTWLPTKLIVVDDGSTDTTVESVRNWLDRSILPYPSKLITQPNAGVSAARNRGVQEAKECDLLAFLDSDDLWPDQYLQRMAASMIDGSDAVAATSDRVVLDADTGKRRPQRFDGVASHTSTWLIKHGAVGMSNTVFRTRSFLRSGGFAEEIPTSEDYHLMLRISMLGPWLHVPKVYVTIRHRYAEAEGEAPALTHFHAHRRLIRARTLHRFIFREGGGDMVPERVWRRRLGSLWYKAGQQLVELGRANDAYDCFCRAVEVQPWSCRARLRQALWRRAVER